MPLGGGGGGANHFWGVRTPRTPPENPCLHSFTQVKKNARFVLHILSIASFPNLLIVIIIEMTCERRTNKDESEERKYTWK